MPSSIDIMPDLRDWLAALPRMKRYGDRPAKGVIAAAMIVLERLRDDCDLRMESHVAEGGAQIAGISSTAVQRILARYGERRDLLGEGGRTNRGNNKPVSQLLSILSRHRFDQRSAAERIAAIDGAQKFLAATVDGYFRLEALRVQFDPATPVYVLVSTILEQASKRDQGGPVAQHLVGAKLELRFPDVPIREDSSSASDTPSGHPGDFVVGTTAFHVSVAPTKGHLARCAINLRGGMDCFMLVPEAAVQYVRKLAGDAGIQQKISIVAIEAFVGQNISELAIFDRTSTSRSFADLLHRYNRRVDAAEKDSSLRIEVPVSLRRKGR